MEREVGGGIGMGNTYKAMADSFQCMSKPTTKKNTKKHSRRKKKYLYKLKMPTSFQGFFWKLFM